VESLGTTVPEENNHPQSLSLDGWLLAGLPATPLYTFQEQPARRT